MRETPRTIRKTRLCDQGEEHDWLEATPEQRMQAVWQITLDAWAMLGDSTQEGGDEPRLLRHVVRVVRGKR
jgi:hypothetical protein